MKKIFFIILIVFFISVFAIAPTSQANSQNTNSRTFVNEVSSWSPGPLDPATNYNSQGYGIIQLAYEGLLRPLNNSITSLTGSLAYPNYTISSNGLSYTFWLKPGITFAFQPGAINGQPFNAYVMQYSMDRAIIMNDPYGAAPYTLDQYISGALNVEANGGSFGSTNVAVINNFLALQSIKAISTYELQIAISKTFIGFIQVLQTWAADAISPKAIIDNEPTSYNTNTTDLTYGMTPLTTFFPGMSNATLLAYLGLPSSYSVLNSGVVANSPATSGAPNAYTWTDSHSAGTGPYIITSNAKGVGATLVQNTHWWDEASVPSQYAISTVTWNQVSSESTRVSDFKAGTVDSIGLSYTNLSQLINTTSLQPLDSGVNANYYYTLNNYFIGFNLYSSIPSSAASQSSTSTYSGSGGNNYTKLHMYTWNLPNGTAQMASPNNPFTAVFFREAFANAFDYNAYINKVYDGLATRMQGAIPLGLSGAQQNLISLGYIPTYQPTVAKALFEKVGWQGTITLSYDSPSQLEEVTLLQQDISNLNAGITIKIQPLSTGTYELDSFSGQLPIANGFWTPDYPDANDYTTAIYANFTNGGTYAPIFNYSNPYVNTLLTEAAVATTTTSRNLIYYQMEQNATQDYPYIYLDQPELVLLTRNWIHGLNNINVGVNTNSMGMFIYPSYEWLTDNSTLQISTSTSTTSTTTSQNTKTNTGISSSSQNTTTIKTTPGFLTVSLLGAMVFIIIRNKKRSK